MSDPSPTTAHSTPKDVFLHLLATIMLYIGTYAIITLLFSCINVLHPDPLSFYYAGELDTLRLSTAMLIVCFPVYLALMHLIHKGILQEPGKSEIGARKWLTYLTIFLAAIMIIIDVITLLYNFLNGELGLRFLLKVLAVGIVATTVFGYYLWEIRHGSAANRKKPMLFAWLSSTAIVLSIALGFVVAGSPWHQRDVRFDERRVGDLQTIQSQVVNYWQMKRVLPQDLGSLADSISGFVPPVDPETGSPYAYQATGTLAFSLCATFKTESTDTQPKGRETIAYPMPMDPYQQNWTHGIGRKCFDRTIDPELYRPAEKPVPAL